MSDNNFNCSDCGGSDGNHFNDCVYDGTDGAYGGGGYRRRRRKSSPSYEMGKLWFLFIMGIVIGCTVNELIGSILLIIFFICAISK